MLDIKLTGQLPWLNAELEPAMRNIAELMYESVRENFLTGGRPMAWPPNRAGTPTLRASGTLEKSIQKMSGDGWAKVGTNLGYAFTQNFGRSFVPSKSAIGFFWARFYETMDSRWKWMALAGIGGKVFKIPQREFMMFQEEDKAKILEMLNSAIFSQTRGANDAGARI
jgi:phage gpG-like protein